MTISNSIHILKTNIETDADHIIVKQLLDQHPEIHEWSLDREDVDRVLRIISPNLSVHQAVTLLRDNGYHCEELPD